MKHLPVDDGYVADFTDQRHGIQNFLTASVCYFTCLDINLTQFMRAGYYTETVAKHRVIELDLKIEAMDKQIPVGGHR